MRLAAGVDQRGKLQRFCINDCRRRGSASASSSGTRWQVDVFSIWRKSDAMRSGWHIDLGYGDDLSGPWIDNNNHRVVRSRVVADAGIGEEQQVSSFCFI